MDFRRFILIPLIFGPLTSVFASESYPTVQAGYHDGFYVKTEDDRFRLKVGSRVNFGYTYGFISPANDFSTFDLIHAKIYAGGNAFSQSIQYYFQAAAANNTRPVKSSPPPESNTGNFTLEDYYVRLSWEDLSIKLGQFKVPFGRQWMIYSGNLEFGDRSLATKAFTFGRDRGVTFGADRETFSYTLGIFNGAGDPSLGNGFSPANFSSTGQNTSNDFSTGRGHLYLARIVAIPMGLAGYSEGDVENSEGARLEIGGGFVFDQDRDVDLNADGIVEDTKADLWNASGELIFKKGGKSIQGEFFYRKVKGEAISDVDALGFYVQPAYFLVSNKFEVALRFGWVDPNLDLSQNRIFEGALATNLYISKDHRYKAQLQYSWRGEEVGIQGRNDDSFIDLLFQLTL